MIHKENLLTLAAYLDTLPEDYEHFEMDWYFAGAAPEAATKYARENGGVSACGAVACAVGHGPAAGFLLNEQEFYGSQLWDDAKREWLDYIRPDWGRYSGRVFCSGNPNVWDFMFGGGWSTVDNTPRGAAARIRMVCDLGEDAEVFRAYHTDPALYRAYLKGE